MEANAPTADEYRNALRRLRVLIVGGGAIGQVFGHHLSEGGAEVSFFLKPQYVEDAQEGFDLHRYGLSGLRPKRHLKPAKVFSDHRVLRGRPFDQVWLCVSSPALRSGILEQLSDALPDAVWVSFQPGVDDRKYLGWKVGADKLVTGLVNFIAYQAPLRGEDLWPEGIAYFVPPMSITQFTGPEPYVSAVANLLQRGELPAGVRPDTEEMARYGSSVLIPFVIALESLGWSWSELRGNSAVMTLLTESVRDIQRAVEKATGKTSGAFSLAQKSLAWKAGLFAAPMLASFPIEEYFKHHFTKVRDQSDQMVDDFVQLCRDNAIIPRPFEALRDQWRARRPRLEQTPTPASRPEEGTPIPDEVPREVTPLPASGVKPPKSIGGAAPERTAVEPTRPMRLAGAETPEPMAQSSARDEDGIAVDFDFDSDELADEPTDAGLLEASSEPLTLTPVDEPLAPGDSGPVLDVELEPLPPVQATPKAQPDGPAPILRSLADLDQVAAIEGPESREAEPTPPPQPKVKPLPFEVPEEPAEEPVPSIIIDHEQLNEPSSRGTQDTIRDPDPGEVHFRGEVPEEEKPKLKRQDFIQTELANEAQNADLRELKARLRSRLGQKKGLSPALENDSDD